jgi:hypothetical protein
MGVYWFKRARWVGMGQARLPLNKFSVAPLSAVPNSRNSKTENFLFLFEKNLGARHQKKCRENFSVLGRKLLQSLRAESGRSGNSFQKFSSKKVRASEYKDTIWLVKKSGEYFFG